MDLKPLGNRIVLTKKKREEKSESGIIIPDTADKEDKSQEGVIVAVGEGKKVAKLGLKKNDLVLYKEYGPSEVKIEEKEYLVADHDDILAIIR